MEISAELQRLIDLQAIKEAIDGYARAVDRHDERLLRAVYHADGYDDHGSFKGPASEYVTWLMRDREPPPGSYKTHHHLGNTLIKLEPHSDRAVAETSLVAHQVWTLEGTSRIDVLGGRFIDQLERREAWRISHRQVVIDFTHCIEPAKPSPREGLFNRGRRDQTDPIYDVLPELRS